MNEIETCSTIYHTSSGDIEIPNEVQATAKSRVAPLWLVFPDHIINTQRIVGIEKEGKQNIFISTTKRDYIIKVSDQQATWKSLQNVFANGVTDD